MAVQKEHMTMTPITAIIPATPAAAAYKPAWAAAVAAAQAAPAEAKDRAIHTLMVVEAKIDSAPVLTLEDAATKLRLALETARRQDLDDDPAWIAVGDALAFLQQSV